MAAGPWVVTTAGRGSLFNGDFDIGSDTFKIALFASTSNIGASSTTFAGVTDEIAASFGYTAGGVAVTVGLSGTTTRTITCTDATWTASGGSIVARFAVLYEVGGNVLAYCLLDTAPADVTATTGNDFVVDNTDGIQVITFA